LMIASVGATGAPRCNEVIHGVHLLCLPVIESEFDRETDLALQ
jgi:hypothetical protein